MVPDWMKARLFRLIFLAGGVISGLGTIILTVYLRKLDLAGVLITFIFFLAAKLIRSRKS